ncbi:hypothetical protein C4H11_11615 [Bacteroides zoogleoformans]|uniref:Uncharacterized protein n=2 Tax=Bacteroides zoogleoformans TaxID=28119 RepID=A0ABM6T9I6_9BACE|nr:hypothetical protein C4H11_11615 [Bacteroides zoogleoformans]
MLKNYAFLCDKNTKEYNNQLKYIRMKGLLKNLGLILVLIGALILMACSFTGNVNNNAILGISVVLVVVGLVSYIAINKRLAD